MPLLLVLLVSLSFFVTKAQKCDITDPLSCSKDKGEVCLFGYDGYSCQCPPSVNRLENGNCLDVNECVNKTFNECHQLAQCIDLPESYTCECNSGYADLSRDTAKPGRICKKEVNECASNVDCDVNAECVDTPESYTCVCLPDFSDVSDQLSKLPGRRCVTEVNECSNVTLNDCDPNAICTDFTYGYTCRCKDGYVDVSTNVTHYPGRSCKRPTAPIEGTNECSRNDCDINAICSNVLGSFKCQCKPGYLDTSPDPVEKPGRACRELINECAQPADNHCSQFAKCSDRKDGYVCECMPGYTDYSSTEGLPPGRKCYNSTDVCAANNCDFNAECIPATGGYVCMCLYGLYDVSHMVNMPPGRICTLYQKAKIECYQQNTDLMFLVDGSTSVGEYYFRNNMLTFIKDFINYFNIGLDTTRVSVVQYSSEARLEFPFSQSTSTEAVASLIDNMEYMRGRTHIGHAIDFVTNVGFSSASGARSPESVTRTCVVLLDGRANDDIYGPSAAARQAGINMVVIGITDGALDEELQVIAGNNKSYLHIEHFHQLDDVLGVRLQSVTCSNEIAVKDSNGGCNPETHKGCRIRNKICVEVAGGQFGCQCPTSFELNPTTDECGRSICNPELLYPCLPNEKCVQTIYGNYRCACDHDSHNATFHRDLQTGKCVTESPSETECQDKPCPDNEECKTTSSGKRICLCSPPLVRARTGQCVPIGWCDVKDPKSCDSRLKETCQLNRNSEYECLCPDDYTRHPHTRMCLIDECTTKQDDCAPEPRGMCTDTSESFLCRCNTGYLDVSSDIVNKPGRACIPKVDACARHFDNCSTNAICHTTDDSFHCECKPGFIDFSPDPSFKGTKCLPEKNECLNDADNDCHLNATCIDTRDSFTCGDCPPEFTDPDEMTRPGRNCELITTTTTTTTTTTPEGSFKCGDEHCFFDLNEACVNDTCQCTDYLERNRNNKCVPPDWCDPQDGLGCNPELNEICTPDLTGQHSCQCDENYTRQSVDDICMFDECATEMHDCAPFPKAVCIPSISGYTCECSVGYLDQSGDLPGRVCVPKVDACARNLHNCSVNAVCRNTEDSFHCECKEGYTDYSLNAHFPGTICFIQRNECLHPEDNDCDPNAQCINTNISYMCRCLPGYIDQDLKYPGRNCTPVITTTEAAEEWDRSGSFPCGEEDEEQFCLIDLNESCIGGKCICRNGEGRKESNETCVPLISFPMSLRMTDGNMSLLESEDYSELIHTFETAVQDLFNDTIYDANFVSLAIDKIVELENDTYMVNHTIFLTPSGVTNYVDACQLWKDTQQMIEGSNTDLSINVEDFDPCLPPGSFRCDFNFCKHDLNEVCVDKECTCNEGEGRQNHEQPCVYLQPLFMSLRVISDDFSFISADGEKLDSWLREDPRAIKIMGRFEQLMYETMNDTVFGDDYVRVEIVSIKVLSEHMALVKCTIYVMLDTTVMDEPLNDCEVWTEITGASSQSHGPVRFTTDIADADPCTPEGRVRCGEKPCQALTLNEVCINDKCTCPEGHGRTQPGVPCIPLRFLPLSVAMSVDGNVPDEELVVKMLSTVIQKSHPDDQFASVILQNMTLFEDNVTLLIDYMAALTNSQKRKSPAEREEEKCHLWVEVANTATESGSSRGIFLSDYQTDTCAPPEYNECVNATDNDCSKDANCFDTRYSFTCVCLPEFIDVGMIQLPGRECKAKPPPPPDGKAESTIFTTIVVVFFVSLGIGYALVLGYNRIKV